MSPLDDAALDTILALQVTVGWAGEKAAEPPRLGYWNTDLTDALAGGDLFTRLVPRTALWAGLELAREAALRVDRAGRQRLAQPDGVWTLFHFGFELDEALGSRLSYHKRQGAEPAQTFADALGIQPTWDLAAFERYLERFEAVSWEESPAGRRLKRLPPEPSKAAQILARALLPLGAAYPLPHGPMPASTDRTNDGPAGGE